MSFSSDQSSPFGTGPGITPLHPTQTQQAAGKNQSASFLSASPSVSTHHTWRDDESINSWLQNSHTSLNPRSIPNPDRAWNPDAAPRIFVYEDDPNRGHPLGPTEESLAFHQPSRLVDHLIAGEYHPSELKGAATITMIYHVMMLEHLALTDYNPDTAELIIDLERADYSKQEALDWRVSIFRGVNEKASEEQVELYKLGLACSDALRAPFDGSYHQTLRIALRELENMLDKLYAKRHAQMRQNRIASACPRPYPPVINANFTPEEKLSRKRALLAEQDVQDAFWKENQEAEASRARARAEAKADADLLQGLGIALAAASPFDSDGDGRTDAGADSPPSSREF